MVEGSTQTVIQGYILIRLWIPWQFMPHVGGANVKPWLLGTRVATTSAHGMHDAAAKLQNYASYQTGGGRAQFLHHMVQLGGGLAPSHFFELIHSRQIVTIIGNWGTGPATLTELGNLGRAARQSDTLEALVIRDAG